MIITGKCQPSAKKYHAQREKLRQMLQAFAAGENLSIPDIQKFTSPFSLKSTPGAINILNVINVKTSDDVGILSKMNEVVIYHRK